MAAALLVGLAPAQAGELRLSYQELARLVGSIFADAKIYLNSKPGFLGFAAKSSLSFGGQTFEFDIPPLSRRVAGGEYAYHVSDVTSSSVRIVAAQSALRITATFEAEGPEVVGTCSTGNCLLVNSMPQIEWRAPAVSVDLVPSDFGGSLSLVVKGLTVGGQLELVCPEGSNLGCRLAASFARSRVASLAEDLKSIVRRVVNSPEGQKKIADLIRPKLTVGPAGPVTISSVASDQKGLVVSFRLAGAQ